MKIEEAEKAIAQVLKAYEEASGQLVRSVEIKNIDVTTYDSGRPEWIRQVVIDAEYLPGTNWGQA
jgi:hypothetical protein